MKRYKSHKEVEASRITAVGGPRWENGIQMRIVATFEDGTFDLPVGKKQPEEGDYVVRYSDGYVSWSPAKAFDEGYTPVEGETQ